MSDENFLDQFISQLEQILSQLTDEDCHPEGECEDMDCSCHEGAFTYGTWEVAQ